MFDELMAAKAVELSEAKYPNEVERINDPNYFKHHRLTSNPIKKCFVFKDKIMQLIREGHVVLEEDKASANLTTVVILRVEPVIF
jgi:hypothetical protein